jgi:hypothetical protein
VADGRRETFAIGAVDRHVTLNEGKGDARRE